MSTGPITGGTPKAKPSEPSPKAEAVQAKPGPPVQSDKHSAAAGKAAPVEDHFEAISDKPARKRKGRKSSDTNLRSAETFFAKPKNTDAIAPSVGSSQHTGKKPAATAFSGPSPKHPPTIGGLSPAELHEALNASQTADLALGSRVHKAVSQAASGLGKALVGDLLFTQKDIETIVNANLKTDKSRQFFDSTAHFDGLPNFQAVQANWDRLQSRYEQVIAKTASKKEALQSFGHMLHGVQDFYSHSNYVELYQDYFEKKSGRKPGEYEYPTYEQGLKDPEFRKVLEAKLETGSFTILGVDSDYLNHLKYLQFQPDLLSTAPPPNPYFPGLKTDVGDLNSDPHSHSQMAKDDSNHPLHRTAVRLAATQSRQEVAKFKRALETNSALQWPRRLPSDVT